MIEASNLTGKLKENIYSIEVETFIVHRDRDYLYARNYLQLI